MQANTTNCNPLNPKQVFQICTESLKSYTPSKLMSKENLNSPNTHMITLATTNTCQLFKRIGNEVDVSLSPLTTIMTSIRLPQSLQKCTTFPCLQLANILPTCCTMGICIPCLLLKDQCLFWHQTNQPAWQFAVLAQNLC